MAEILLTQQHNNKMHISSVTNSEGTYFLEPLLQQKDDQIYKKNTIQSTDKTKK